MSYINTIQRVLLYIDDNLKNDLHSEMLADIAYLSTYHFCRVFQWHVGYSVMEYIRIRRLTFAASELLSGKKIIDIALEYGFETHSGFSKAFKRHYGISPLLYRMQVHTTQNKPPLPDILRMNKYFIGGIVMEPKFVTLPAINLAGYSINTKHNDGQNTQEIPAFWTAYLKDGRVNRLHHADFVKSHAEYGACFPEKPESGEFSYVIGVEIKEGSNIPKEFHTCQIPPATYAVFSSPPCERNEFSKNIQSTWRYIMEEWFPSSGYEYANGCVDYEYYDDKCMGEKDLVCDIYIPVAKKNVK